VPLVGGYIQIEGAAEDVARVIAEEREERELRKAEMEAAKAQVSGVPRG
jgi:hypothetical protein